MYFSQRTKRIDLICLVLVALSCFVRLLAQKVELPFSYNNLIFFLYTFALLLWSRQLQIRILQRPVRWYLFQSAVLMIFWMGLRTLKYTYIPKGHVIGRYVDYLYYLPMLFIPLFILFSVLHIGKAEDQGINRFWKLLYLPSTLLLALILTNDLHQKAFWFYGHPERWTGTDVQYRAIYFAAMIWIGCMLLAALIAALMRCRVPGIRKRIWLPILPIAFGAMYALVYMIQTDFSYLVLEMIKPPEVGSFVLAAFIECLILVRLFPVNDNYGNFWNMASIGAGIMDDNNAFCYVSDKSLAVTPEQVKVAQTQPVVLPDGNMVLKSQPIDGGISYWLKDISQINHLNKELANYVDVLQEENDLIDAENQLMASQIQIEEQSRLYDAIASDVRDQVNVLESLFAGFSGNTAEKRKAIQDANVLVAYIKRRANLMLLADQMEEISGSELTLAIYELLEALKLCGISCAADIKEIAALPSAVVLIFYEFIEQVVEAALPNSRAIMLYLALAGNQICLKIEVDTSIYLPVDVWQTKIKNQNGTLEIKESDGTEYISLLLPCCQMEMMAGKEQK
ncbi:hypothetical protein EII17_05180 [Clostridiales bacterium COT073_COT-073]|nr:hypothetical protein EII17_05180 [Clostridiales bacterium COT073_COT-073]